MSGKPSKRVLWVLTALPVLLCLLLATGYLAYITQQHKRSFPVKLEGDWSIAGDPTLGFVAAPNSAMTRHHPRQNRSFNVYTDGRSGRVNHPGDTTPKQADILTIGGSYAWGHLVENQDTFTSIIGREMGASTANLSFGSYGTLQALQLLRKNADLSPKVIIYGVITDHERRILTPCAPSYSPFCIPVSYMDLDPQGVPYVHAPPEPYSAKFGHGFYRDVATTSGWAISDPLWGARIALAKFKKQQYLAAGLKDTPEHRAAAMNPLMAEMAAEAERLDATLVVVYMPFVGLRTPNPPSDILLDAIEALPQKQRDRLIFVDTTPRVAEHYRNPFAPFLGFPQDGHPTQLAHRMIANQIIKQLKAQNLLQ